MPNSVAHLVMQMSLTLPPSPPYTTLKTNKKQLYTSWGGEGGLEETKLNMPVH